MRDDEIRARLREQNPWWRSVISGGDALAWTQTDPTLRSRSKVDLGYRSDVLDDIATDQIDDKLVILRGPLHAGDCVFVMPNHRKNS